MSLRYKGGVISATPPTTTGGESGSAPGVWTLEQQMQINAAGNWPIQPLPKYIEDVFSTYLYTGNGSTQTITNGIDLSGKGGLVWTKCRTQPYDAEIYDTSRGVNKPLIPSSTAAQTSVSLHLTSFNSNGFTLGANENSNAFTDPAVSWTFRKQPKFFDVVTYTGNGVNGRTISHSLGSTPGCVIVKRTDDSAAWIVRHRAGGGTNFLLNTTAAGDAGTTYENGNVSGFSSTTFTVSSGSTINAVNANGGTYVAYLFAHDAGGFGDAGDQNVISCGSFTTDGSGIATVTLGYEPQWVLVKVSSTTGSWRLLDNMRGIPTGGNDAVLFANLTAAEDSGSDVADLNATGFSVKGLNASADFVYIAIRRGPMKTPTTGTSVYAAATGLSTSPVFVSGFPTDFFMEKRTESIENWYQGSRLTGSQYMSSNNTNAEATGSSVTWDYMNGVISAFAGSTNYFGWMFRRAPGFFDVVCYTGTGSARTVSHNLGVAPELIIVKKRNSTADWAVYSAPTGNTDYLYLNSTAAKVASSGFWNNTSPTSSVFTVNDASRVNNSGDTYVAYLFASVSGVSKVGSYTGTGTTQQINCGFTNGSRFVLIKRTDSTGDWYVWDSARGIVAGNDPYLLLNSTAAEVTNTDYVDTYSAGFEISSTAPAAINANGGTFIFLAIA